MITVQQLIEQLQNFDPTQRVVIVGYESGYKDLTQIKPVVLALDVNTEWYYGPHEKTEDENGTHAVFLR